jgi:hypothetical protein
VKRKTIATIVASLLALTLLPAQAALAEANGTAHLTAGVNVHPGASQEYTVRVQNSEPILIGRRINFIRIVLPSNAGIRTATAGGYTAPEGWEVFATSAGALQQLTYRATNSGLGPNQSLDLPFPADVLRPSRGDRLGTFGVSLSSDGGDSFHTASAPAGQTLTSRVRVLEILDGSLRAVNPPGVRDGSGTAGQTIEYAFGVFNHATQSLTVQPTLASSNNNDQITQANAASVSAGGSTTFVSGVTLGGANQDRTSTFTAHGAATWPWSAARRVRAGSS